MANDRNFVYLTSIKLFFNMKQGIGTTYQGTLSMADDNLRVSPLCP